MKPLLFHILLIFCAVRSLGDSNGFNYAEALQKSLYFYEAQQSGRLSPNNRVAWRGPSCLMDGQDIGKDLSGGWFDAGDHWTANLTMSFAAMTLAWSAVEHPEAYVKTGQMDELLENLIYVNDYFLRCVLNSGVGDPGKELEVVIGCGGREGVDSPNVHSMWAPAEVAHRMTRRPTFRLTHAVPGGDIPAAMAAAMAASSIVIRENSDIVRGKKGYLDFNGGKFADTLLNKAELLWAFARANAGPVVTEQLAKSEQERIRTQRTQALRADGKVVGVGYRADPFDKLVAAASWLQRAHVRRDPRVGSKWFDRAMEVYENEYKAESNHDWWKDFGAGNFAKVAAFNLMRLAPSDERFHAELQLYCSRFAEYKQTPGGLRLREWFAHEYGSLRHANNAAVIALYYSEHVEKAPALTGNTWWKANRSNSELQAQYSTIARQQVDYALGANPYRRSYLVGFGNEPFNHPHHRGAYGAWAGFDHFIPGKADDRTTNRHVLYGALIAGPDHNDVFLCGKDHLKWLPLPSGQGHGFSYKFPNREELVPKEGYQRSASDMPYQDVMDSTFNEVALDYNAGITASLAWLTAKGHSQGGPLPDSEFPPKSARTESEDLLRTDREFFVTARKRGDSPKGFEFEATLHNRSRWPARSSTNLSFRVYFKLEPGVPPSHVAFSIKEGQGTMSKLQAINSDSPYVEVSFPNDEIYPGNTLSSQRTVRVMVEAPQWNPTNDGSLNRLTPEWRLLPELPVYEGGTRLAGKEPSTSR